MSDHHRRAVARPPAHPGRPAGRGGHGLRRAPPSRGLLVGERGTLFLVAADHPARGMLGHRRRPDGDGRPAVAAGAARHGAGRPGRRRRARLARRGRGAAAARRARGQGRDRLDEPRRPGRRLVDDGRPVHRLRRRRASSAAGSRAARCCCASTTTDPGTAPTIEACAQAVSELADRGLMAMVEPLPYERDGRRHAAPAPGRRVAGPGRHGGRRRWARPAPTPGSSCPSCDDPETVFSATTLPCVVLGGVPGPDPATDLESWGRALRQPAVRGLVVGRALLYPPDGDVAVGGRTRPAEVLERQRAGRREPASGAAAPSWASDPGDLVLLTPGGRRLGVDRAAGRRAVARACRARSTTGESEVFVLPLAGAWWRRSHRRSTGRRRGGVRARRPRARSSPGSPTSGTSAATAVVTLTQRRRRRGGAAVGALQRAARRPAYGAAEDVPVEVRGAGTGHPAGHATSACPGAWDHAEKLVCLRAADAAGQLVELPAAQARRDRRRARW